MHPILFTFGGIPIYSYGVLVATGVLISLWYGRRQAPRAGIDPDKLWNMGIYFVLVALLVAKIWLILSAWDFYMANPRYIFSVATFQSGGTFYGGVVGGVLTILLYTHFQKMPLLPTLDTCAAALPIGHAIGRLGCFAAGCCYGKPTAVAWGVVVQESDGRAAGRHAAGSSSASHAALRSGAGIPEFSFLDVAGETPALRRPDFRRVLDALRHRARHY